MKGTNFSQAVVVIGDSDTADRGDMLATKAAENGATIAETYAFEKGAGAAHDDLTDIGPVVEALSRAIVTRRDVWLPFPLEDLSREAHFRRLSLALQRHGLNLRMGPAMSPCPVEGGYSAIDAALRDEVHAVDALDQAAVAAAGLKTLSAEIEATLAGPGAPSAAACAGERIYSTREAAEFLGQSVGWVSWGLRERVFTYDDGFPIEPLRIGRSRRRRYTVSMLRGMARSGHRIGVLNRRELDRVLAKLPRTAR